ncbi:S8 family peptidase [Deinococcus deserti]|uniref:Putative peptidase S8 and S53, subtilisin, kexin, sedolisin n=1 Tax=Deinococcus deserti (strain DSM 17065 / CIP 109153 / LMG 22923 / VCD115) TaxID=546414 RepID=C1CYG2_DEIDV|nr:S8 family peptidase [Deinococcus deserti]ACO44983.1 putative peptidase S8 and S53, subtilisin, kexin, sedolisin precursor [Deinococcus deserti VCD115]
MAKPARHALLLPGLLLTATLAACGQDSSPTNADLSAQVASTSHPAVAGEILVQFTRGAGSQGVRDVERQGLRVAEQVAVTDGAPLYRMQVTNGQAVDALVRALSRNPNVRFAEPNWIYTHAATSNDPFYTDGTLWGMHGDATTPANQFGSQAGEAWANNHIGSKDVYIGVIDEGIQFTHPDLANNIWVNPFDPADGVDNDGNGYVDDTRGWDFANGNNTIFDGNKREGTDEHGTHVAGTIGGIGGNGQGVAGVNWNVTMISGKFLGARGGSLADAIKAVDYFTDLKKRHGLNIVATSNSWGGGGFSQGLLDAINRGGDAGILFIAAAGNGGSDGVGDNNDTTATYPSNYECTNAGTRGWDCVIAVAAIDKTGALARFSNYGAKTVDVGAPGVAVMSTLPTNTYGSYNGTSMATPHVSGGAALYASTNAGATARQIRDAITSSALFTTSLNGKTVTNGRLNVSGF